MTPFHPARLATEKAVIRPALPTCSKPGMTEVQMDKKKHLLPLGAFIDHLDGTWEARLQIEDGKEPVVHLIGPIPGVSYNLHNFLSIAPSDDKLRITDTYPDNVLPDRVLDEHDVGLIAKRSLARLSRLDGRFEIRWVPNDPRVPF